MREIKFRAWDKKGKVMLFAESTLLDVSFNGYICKEGILHKRMLDFELMQFTGLLDKNGKEVYEGDILKLQYPLNYGFAGIHNKEIIVTISFESGCFWFSGEGYTDCNWHFYNEYEVIGNIYENP